MEGLFGVVIDCTNFLDVVDVIEVVVVVIVVEVAIFGTVGEGCLGGRVDCLEVETDDYYQEEKEGSSQKDA